MNKVNSGYSLVEMLVVMGIFSVLAVMITQVLAASLKSAKRVEVTTKIRTNLDFALASMERNLRNAKTVSCPSATQVNFTGADGGESYFVYSGQSIASGSANLTGNTVKVTTCSFTCTTSASSPPMVEISLTAQDPLVTGLEGAQVTINSRILLRSYRD